MMLEGTIKIWRPELQFGIVRPRNRHDRDVIFFARQIPDDFRPIVGARVEYDVIRAPGQRNDKAATVRPVANAVVS